MATETVAAARRALARCCYGSAKNSMIRSDMPPLAAFGGTAALPESSRLRLVPAMASGAFHSSVWFEVLAETCPEPSWVPLFLGDETGSVVALLKETRSQGRHVESFGNYYTCEYSPFLGAAPSALASTRLAEWLSAARPRIDTLQLRNMRADQVDCTALAAAFRRSGWAVQVYEQFGNWYEPTAGVDYGTYLSARDGKLRSTIDRKTRRFLRMPGAKLEILRTIEQLEHGLQAYLDVHARSWKQPEPFPEFIPSFVRRFGEIGAIRIGVASAESRPLAAQIWLTWGRRATIAKLAYDDTMKALSPGTVLTAHMLEDALNARTFDEIDLGRGDDGYKRDWLGRRRPVLGMVIANPRSVRGLAAAARHLGPPLIRGWMARLRGNS